MKYLWSLLFVFPIITCSTYSTSKAQQVSNVLNQKLMDKLAALTKDDANIQEYYANHLQDISVEILNRKRDSVFYKNGEEAKALFKKHGFPGIDLVGEAGARNFFLLIQHSDYQPEFQEEVLGAMRLAVDANNANSQDYAYLYDRVRKNKGLKQVYGTQITHNSDMWAIPTPLVDSLTVNERRKEIGLESIEAYLNNYMRMHFEMNADYYRKAGIKEPFAYSLKP